MVRVLGNTIGIAVAADRDRKAFVGEAVGCSAVLADHDASADHGLAAEGRKRLLRSETR